MRLGQCYDELHYGTVLWILSLLWLAVTKLGGKLRTVRPAKRSHSAIRRYAIPVFARNIMQSNRALRTPHYYGHAEYFMESAGIRYLPTSFWRISNRTSERSERVKFLIQKQRVRIYRTKHFACGIVLIIYILRHSLFWQPCYFKSFQNAKIVNVCRYARWNDKRNEASAY